jgi:DNA-binding HxlR family transcriptional regulator
MYSITMNKQLGSIRPATEIIGDKWTPELLRYFLSEDTVRFCQLQDLVGGINPRTLSARLTQLEDQGIISKCKTDSSRCEYRLTDKGRDLLPILQTMQLWSQKYA